jgi:hypothetical protein
MERSKGDDRMTMKLIDAAGQVVAQMWGDYRPRYGTMYHASVCLPGAAVVYRQDRSSCALERWAQRLLADAGVAWVRREGELLAADAFAGL